MKTPLETLFILLVVTVIILPTCGCDSGQKTDGDAEPFPVAEDVKLPGRGGREGGEEGQDLGNLSGDQERILPAGFVRTPGVSGSGQVLFLETTETRSASRQLVEAVERLSTYFDEPLTSLEGFREKDDRQAQLTFIGQLSGQAVSGVAVSLITGAKGVVGIVFDRRDVLPETIGSLMSTLDRTLPERDSGGRTAPQQLEWYTAYFPDGSGRINIPRGWQVTSSYKGGADIAGPDGEAMAVGIGVPVGTPEAVMNPMTGMPMQGALVGYPSDPASALATIAPQLAAVSYQAISDLRVLESSPVASATGGQAAFLLYDVRVNGVPYRAFSLVDCSPVSAGWWTFYYSTVTAPAEKFREKLPVMLQAWQGWSVNPQVFQERLNRAMNSMRETSKIYSEAIQNQQQTFDNAMADWTEVFRGTRTVRDTRTGEEGQTDIGWVNETVDRLNERSGYERYEQIPLRQYNMR